MGEAASLTTGELRSVILMSGIPSMFEAFKNRKSIVEIPRTFAAAPTTTVRSIPLPKRVLAEAASAAAIDSAQRPLATSSPAQDSLVVVDLGERRRNPSSYGAVFTSEPDDGPCWYCRREVKPHLKVGIVLRIRDDRFHHLLIVDIEGRACNTSCAFKFVKEHATEHACYEGRETAMQQINEICAPGTKLVAAPNWRLLKINGGPFTDEQFDKESCPFAPTPNLQFRLCSLTFGPS